MLNVKWPFRIIDHGVMLQISRRNITSLAPSIGGTWGWRRCDLMDYLGNNAGDHPINAY